MRSAPAARAVSPPPPALPTERLTWEEIRRRFPDQQVYVIEPVRSHPDHPDFLSALVVGASTDREAAFEQAAPYGHAGHLIERRFTGRSKQPLIRPPMYLESSGAYVQRPWISFDEGDEEIVDSQVTIEVCHDET